MRNPHVKAQIRQWVDGKLHLKDQQAAIAKRKHYPVDVGHFKAGIDVTRLAPVVEAKPIAPPTREMELTRDPWEDGEKKLGKRSHSSPSSVVCCCEEAEEAQEAQEQSPHRFKWNEWAD